MTKRQFKDRLRSELILFKELLKLVDEGETDSLRTRIQTEIKRCEQGLQD